MSAASHASVTERLTLFLVLAFVVAFAVIPLGRLVLEAVAPGGVLDFGPMQDVLSSASTWRAAGHSIETSFAGMIGGVLLGAVFAFVVTLTDVRLKLVLVFCFMLPMMIPPQITALSWIQVFGPSSALLNTLGIAPPLGSSNPVYSREGIMILLAVQHAPLAFLVLRAAFRQLPRELIEAARMAGARPARIAFTIVLPLLTPALVASLALTFVSSLGNFGIPAMLGIPTSYYVLPTLIYRRLASFGPSLISEVGRSCRRRRHYRRLGDSGADPAGPPHRGPPHHQTRRHPVPADRALAVGGGMHPVGGSFF